MKKKSSAYNSRRIKMVTLRNALINGEQSGFVDEFDAIGYLKYLHLKYEIVD